LVVINLEQPVNNNLGADLVVRNKKPVALANSIIDQTGFGSYIEI